MSELAVAYCRVSTKEQQQSIIEQQKQWQEIAEKERYILAKCRSIL